jgi:hypothetical protein
MLALFLILNSFSSIRPYSLKISKKIHNCTHPDFVRYIRVPYNEGFTPYLWLNCILILIGDSIIETDHI